MVMLSTKVMIGMLMTVMRSLIVATNLKVGERQNKTGREVAINSPPDLKELRKLPRNSKLILN